MTKGVSILHESDAPFVNACTVLDCEKGPFLCEFLDEPDTPSCHFGCPLPLTGFELPLNLRGTHKYPMKQWISQYNACALTHARDD